MLPKEISFDAFDCLVRSVLCAGLVRNVVRIPKCWRASNVLCAVLCGCCARLVRSVRRRLWVWDIFSGGLVRVLCWGLGRKIPPPWAPNTLYLDKVLCVSCAPGAFAKKSLGQLCAEISSVEISFNKTQYNFLYPVCY